MTMELNSSPPEKNFEQPFAEVEHRSPEKQPITTVNEDKTSSYNDETDSYDVRGFEDDDMVVKQPITTANEDKTSSYNDETDSYDERGFEDDDMDVNDHDCEKCCFTSLTDWDYLDKLYNI